MKELFEDLNKTWSEFKAILDRQEAEIRKHGEATAETKAMIDRINERLDALEVKLSRVPRDKGELPQTEAMKAFSEYLRKGVITPEALKVLAVADDTQAGYLAPVEYANEIIRGIVEFSPIRTIARVRPTTRSSVQFPVRTGVFAARWVAELGQRSETTGLRFGLEEIPTHELYALVDVSLQMLEDSAFNLEQEIQADFAEQFGVAEGAAFVSGNAVGKPEGFLTNPNVGVTNSGHASQITADGVISLYFDLKEDYARNGVWVLNRGTLKAIRQLKDAQGNYLWQPGLAGGVPATILDRPYVVAPDMPDIAANSTPLAFGDFRRGYLIVDRVQIAIQRDPYTQAAQGVVRFHARKRVGGQVVLAEAIRKLKIAA